MDATARKEKHLNYLKDIVMRQTDYDDTQAMDKLKEHNNDVMAIVREFMGGTKIKKDSDTENKSVNQKIYSEIRTFMDNAAASYKLKQFAQTQRQNYIEQAQKELERRKKAQENENVNENENKIIKDIIEL